MKCEHKGCDKEALVKVTAEIEPCAVRYFCEDHQGDIRLLDEQGIIYEVRSLKEL